MSKISEEIDRAPFRSGQILLVALMIIALMLDGLDVKLLSYVAPSILKEWRISEAAFSPALAAALFGMAIGASIGGWMGDRWGRRKIIIAMLFLFAVATLFVSRADTVVLLAVLRLLSGFGFGALTPNALALATEWTPRRLQPRVVAFLSASSPLGGAIGALVALWLIPRVGWQGCFLIVGAVTVAFAVAILWWLPESVTYLDARGQSRSVGASWRRIFGTEATFAVSASGELASKTAPTVARGKLFARPLLRLNAGSFLCFFSGYYVSYAFSSWLPVILTTSGFPIAKAINGSLAYNLAAIVGAMVSGNLIGRLGSRAALFVAAAGSLMALILLGTVLTIQGGGTPMAAMVVLVGFCGTGAGVIASTVSAIVATAYPVELRATGVGFGVMAGRIGGIATTLGGGVLLTMGRNDVRPLFLVLCIMCGLIVLSAWVIDRHIDHQADRRHSMAKRLT